MKVTDFAKQITLQEGLKKGVDIAQISEVLKVANNLLNGELYSMIKKQPAVTTMNVNRTARALVNKGKSTAPKKVAVKKVAAKKSTTNKKKS